MAKQSAPPVDEVSDELKRVMDQLTARLRARGVDVNSEDSSEDLATLLEAVEAFEMAVEARGGDLMVDEPPAGQTAEPDNPAFVLPMRSAGEPIDAFIFRVETASRNLRR